MDRVVLGVIIAALVLSLSTTVQATVFQPIGLECVDGNLSSVLNIDGDILPIEKNCPNGCAQVPGGYTCQTSSFIIPMELYLLFQVIAFAFLFMTILILSFKENDNGDDNIIFPLLSLILFAALGIMSFNLIGMAFLMGAALNGSLALLSLVYVILVGVGTWTGNTRSA
jgi:hypothetical protein